MSFNLHLNATRQVFTKSGRETTQVEQIDLYQTPTVITNQLLSLKDFDAILNGYLNWVEEKILDSNDEPYTYWYPIFEEEELNKIKIGEIFCIKDSYEVLEYEIVEIALPGEEEFIKNGTLWDYTLIAVVKLQNLPYRTHLKNKIKRYKDDEWELEFYTI